MKAILFDLDGTLLNADVDGRFMGEYFQKLSDYVADIIPRELFLKELWSATEAMIKSTDRGRTNQRVFLDCFCPRVGYDEAFLLPIFDEFYCDIFPDLQNGAGPRKGAKEVIEFGLQQEYDLVVATNPLFPEVAINERLRWGGFQEVPFKLITSYENMHFTKPHAEYYREISNLIGQKPGDCIMVGNDFEADLIPAAEAGMLTFYLTEEGSQGTDGFVPDGRGDFFELLRFLGKH